LSPVGSGICNATVVDRQKSQRRIDTFDIGVQCVQCSAKRLALHLAEFSPSIVERSLEFVAVKKFGKELGNGDRHNKWTAR